MRKAGLITGAIITLLGLSVMATPLRTYFIIGWIIGCVLLCNGLTTLWTSIRKKNRNINKCIMGAITTLIGVALLVTDLQQILTETLVVYLVAGGIMISGLIECFVGYFAIKNKNKGIPTLILGLISFSVGVAGLIYQHATVIIIGVFVGYHIVRIGISIFTSARSMEKPIIIDGNVEIK